MARSSAIWLADLLRASADLAPDDEALREICAQLDVDARLPTALAGRRSMATPVADIDIGADAAPADADQTPPAPPTAAAGKAALWPVFSEFEPIADAAGETTESDTGGPAWLGSTEALRSEASPPPRAPDPLLPTLQRRAILATALGVDVADGGLDLDRVVHTLSHGLPLCGLPRRPRRTLRYGVEVWLDRAPWLEPFHADQQALVTYLRTLFPSDRVVLRRCKGSPQEIRPRRRGSSAPGGERPDWRAAALLLTDFGAGYRPLGVPPPAAADWRRQARQFARQQRVAVALLPLPPTARVATAIRELASLPWNERTTVRDAARLRSGAPADRSPELPLDDQALLALARVLSPAVRIDPWLLRAARRRFLPRYGAELEAALWFGPLVASRGADGIVLESALLPELRAGLREQGPAVLGAAVALVEAAHAHYPATLRLEEQLLRIELEQAPGQPLAEHAVELALRPALKALAGSDAAADDVAIWAAHAWGRFSSALRGTDAARQLAFASAARLQGASWMLPPGETSAPAFPIDIGWLLRARKRPARELAIELKHGDDGSFELAFHEATVASNARHRLRLPDTTPLWLQLVDPSGTVRAVAFAAAAGAPSVPLDAAALQSSNGVVLRTLAGDEYALRVTGSVEQALSRSVLALSARAEKSSGEARPAPNVALVAHDLAIAWPDDGPDGEALDLLDGQGRSTRALRVGRIDFSEKDVRVGATVLRLDRYSLGVDKLPWVALDASARLLDPSLPGKAPDLQPAISWPHPGRFEYSALRAVHGKFYSEEVDQRSRDSVESRLRSQGGLVMPAGAVDHWALLFPASRAPAMSKKALPRLDGELLAVPVAAALAAAASLAAGRWRACVIVADARLPAVAAELHAHLVKQLGPWRVLPQVEDTTEGRPRASSAVLAEYAVDAMDGLREAIGRCELLIVVGVWRRSKLEALNAQLALARRLGRALLLVVPADTGVRDDVAGMQPDEVVTLPGPEALDDHSLRRIVEHIAAFRLPGAVDAGETPGSAAARAGDAGVLDSLATGFRTRLCRQLEKNVPRPGLFEVSLHGDFALRAFLTPRGSAPLLILVHSLATNSEATFGALWQPPADVQRRALLRSYGERVYAFEHHAVSHSPIHNALQLALALPAGATLHFLTHSAGGLIGELFARGLRVDGQPAFDERDLALFQGGTVGAAERAMLEQLSSVFADKRFRVERFVRVACPARGTRIFSETPAQALAAMRGAMSLLSPLAGLAGSALSSVFQALQDPEVTPGFAVQDPGSPLVQMLNRPDVVSAAPLTVIGGVTEAGGLLSRLVGAATTAVAFGHADNDRIVSLESARGGVRRAASGAEFVDRGQEVDHFSYFQNARSRQAIVAALLSAEPLPAGFSSRESTSQTTFSR